MNADLPLSAKENHSKMDASSFEARASSEDFGLFHWSFVCQSIAIVIT